MNILNKIKQDNNENIQKIKSYYENNFISISELHNNNSISNNFSKIDETNVEKLSRINNDFSRIKSDELIENNSNNLSLNSFREQFDEKNEYKKKLIELQNKNIIIVKYFYNKLIILLIHLK